MDLMRIPVQAKEKPKRAPLSVIIINEQANEQMDRYADALDRSFEPDGTSAVDVAMDLEKILFAVQENGNAGQNPTGGSTALVERIHKPIVYEKV